MRDQGSRSDDVMGRVYEYFLSQFAGAEGKKGGEFDTPRSVVRLLVKMLEPYNGRIYHPCCGSSGMFVQSADFIQEYTSGNGHGGKAKSDIVHLQPGVQLHHLAPEGKLNLAIRGIEVSYRPRRHLSQRPTLRPAGRLHPRKSTLQRFRLGWIERLTDDKRWQYGVPPKGNANFAWVQHYEPTT